MSNEIMLDFYGETFERERDGARLGAQLSAVKGFMLTHGWVTLSQISEATNAPEASVSARLRDLRTPRGGNFIIQRRYISRGLHEYRLVTDHQQS
jgi:RIO-like serine/threonine protein kinase